MPPAHTSLTLPCEAARLLPHKPPVRMLDQLLTWKDGAGQAGAVVDRRSSLLDSRGRLDRNALIELMAQAYAAGKSWEGRRRGQTPRIGYLVGIGSFEWTDDAMAGERLLISVATEGVFGDFIVVSGHICREDHHQLARGELRLWRRPPDVPGPAGGAAP